MVGPQAFEGLLQLLPGSFGVAPLTLACEENLLAVRGQRGAEFLFRFAVAVRGRHVEVVDAACDGLGHGVVGLLLFHSHHDNSTEADHRKADVLVVRPLGDWGVRPQPGQRTGGYEAGFQKIASVHNMISTPL